MILNSLGSFQNCISNNMLVLAVTMSGLCTSPKAKFRFGVLPEEPCQNHDIFLVFCVQTHSRTYLGISFPRLLTYVALKVLKVNMTFMYRQRAAHYCQCL